MKVLYVAVFDNEGISSDTSAAMAFSNNEMVTKVIGYDYRTREKVNNTTERDNELIEICRQQKPDLVFFVKCNGIHVRVFDECKKICPIAYWFADPLVTFLADPEFAEKAEASDYVFVDKENVLSEIKKINKNVFIVPDGYDRIMEVPIETKEEDKIDVTFIGYPYGERVEKINNIEHPVTIISDAYGFQHSHAVSKSRINLNFCTSDGPSNRIYKVMASKGFLLTDDWIGREKHFEDGKHLVIFKNMEDLNDKIKYYLSNDEERNRIAASGHAESPKYTRDVWAAKCLDIVNNT